MSIRSNRYHLADRMLESLTSLGWKPGRKFCYCWTCATATTTTITTTIIIIIIIIKESLHFGTAICDENFSPRLCKVTLDVLSGSLSLKSKLT